MNNTNMSDKELLPCPLCGKNKGYSLSEGSTYRWWNMTCNGCGRIVDECSSDRRMTTGTPLPERCRNADEAWNDAGEYAESLRQQLAQQPSVDVLVDAERYRWLRERYVMANFDIYNAEKFEDGVSGIIFEMPEGITYSADINAVIDEAMTEAKPIEKDVK